MEPFKFSAASRRLPVSLGLVFSIFISASFLSILIRYSFIPVFLKFSIACFCFSLVISFAAQFFRWGQRCFGHIRTGTKRYRLKKMEVCLDGVGGGLSGIPLKTVVNRQGGMAGRVPSAKPRQKSGAEAEGFTQVGTEVSGRKGQIGHGRFGQGKKRAGRAGKKKKGKKQCPKEKNTAKGCEWNFFR